MAVDAAADPGTRTDPGRDDGGGGQATERRSAGTQHATAALADIDRRGGDPLATHDDKWTTREHAGLRYRVDLPDGDVTYVGSKVDVRALLVRHCGTGDH